MPILPAERRNGPQACDDLRENLQDPIDFFLRRVPAETESGRAVDRRERDVHRAQNVGRFQRAARAGRPARRADPVLGKLVEDRLALDEMARNVRRVRHAFRLDPVDLHVRDPLEQFFLEVLLKEHEIAVVLKMRTKRAFQRHGDPDDVRDVFGPAAASAFLMPADEERPDARAAPHEQKPHPLRSVKLMPRAGEEIDVPEVLEKQVFRALRGERDRDLRDRLRRVRVEQNFRVGLFRDAGQIGDREQNARFVIRVHDRNQQRISRLQRAHKIGFAQASLTVHREVRHAVAAAFHFLADRKNGRMLHGGRDDVLPVLVGGRRAENHVIIALGRAGGEKNFTVRVRIEKSRDALPGEFDLLRDAGGGGVHRAGIKIFGAEERLHRLKNLGGDAGRRVIVYVNDRIFHKTAFDVYSFPKRFRFFS